jgi:hypothetical protein
MNYLSGLLVRLGDKVELWIGCNGTVVCSVDTAEYANDYPESVWSQLGTGVLILSDAAGLIHLVEPNEDLIFLERAHAFNGV